MSLSPLWQEMLPEIVAHHILPHVLRGLCDAILEAPTFESLKELLRRAVELGTRTCRSVSPLPPAVLIPLVVRAAARVDWNQNSGAILKHVFGLKIRDGLDGYNEEIRRASASLCKGAFDDSYPYYVSPLYNSLLSRLCYVLPRLSCLVVMDEVVAPFCRTRRKLDAFRIIPIPWSELSSPLLVIENFCMPNVSLFPHQIRPILEEGLRARPDWIVLRTGQKK